MYTKSMETMYFNVELISLSAATLIVLSLDRPTTGLIHLCKKKTKKNTVACTAVMSVIENREID